MHPARSWVIDPDQLAAGHAPPPFHRLALCRLTLAGELQVLAGTVRDPARVADALGGQGYWDDPPIGSAVVVYERALLSVAMALPGAWVDAGRLTPNRDTVTVAWPNLLDLDAAATHAWQLAGALRVLAGDGWRARSAMVGHPPEETVDLEVVWPRSGPPPIYPRARLPRLVPLHLVWD